MNKLLATTAIALVAMASTASAQSVLERVLSEIDNSTNLARVNGTFANIAENLGTSVDTEVTVYASNATGAALTEDEYAAALASAVDSGWSALVSSAVVSDEGVDTIEYTVGEFKTTDRAEAEARARATVQQTFAATYTVDTITVAGGAVEGVNGSITNTIQGVTAAVAAATQSATAGDTVAYEFVLPEYDLGALRTTALGAVNTGDITLGVNSAVDDAKTSSTQAVSTVMQQLGGADGNGALVLNIASNMTGVNGSINNTMDNVNGALESASTTALGAVNTGTIVSGVNAAVQGITGTSGQANGFAPVVAAPTTDTDTDTDTDTAG